MTAGGTVLPPLLAALDDEHRRRLTALTSPVRFGEGEVIFREGAPATRCWLIGSGSVVLTTHVPGRGAVALETLHGGDVLGWSWLGARPVWQFAAHAAAATEAAEIDITALERMAGAEPEFGYVVTRALSGLLIARLQSTRARLLDLYANRREM
ncbi:cyclic nucleotide-binding domain-containing protein [Rhodococcus sp. NPDC019627]|uniref:cyclic nucleotide-binding domain-containing protein n=1 Tax=unclassified Rhodococcus (in: high G+C Gram-positive bacteria) TaxID=192944 RepID=UPI00340C7B41